MQHLLADCLPLEIPSIKPKVSIEGMILDAMEEIINYRIEDLTNILSFIKENKNYFINDLYLNNYHKMFSPFCTVTLRDVSIKGFTPLKKLEITNSGHNQSRAFDIQYDFSTPNTIISFMDQLFYIRADRCANDNSWKVKVSYKGRPNHRILEGFYNCRYDDHPDKMLLGEDVRAKLNTLGDNFASVIKELFQEGLINAT